MKKKLSDFTIGDRVSLVADTLGRTGMAAKAGAEAVVTGKDSYFGWLTVKWDRNVNDLAMGQMDGNYSLESFKVIPAAPAAEYIIIVKSAGGKYEPASFPKLYSSEAQALAVADKMAKLHNGEFVVFKTIASSFVPPPFVPAPVVKRFA